MTGMGQLKWYLGINFTFTKDGVFLFQKPFIEDMFHMFKMACCNSTKVLMAEGSRLSACMNKQRWMPPPIERWLAN
jgi:hypothetical protein